MKLRKKIEITLVATLGVSLMLLIVLLTHFAMSQPLDKGRLEISKFEFQKSLSAAGKIHKLKMLNHAENFVNCPLKARFDSL